MSPTQITDSSITSALKGLKKSILDLILPMTCVVCNKEGDYLCQDCETDLPRLEKPYCMLCANPGVPQLCQDCYNSAPRFDAVRAPYIYEGHVQHVVQDLKYRGMRAAAPYIGEVLAKYLQRNPYPVDVLLPVPLHGRRERQRGYNQSELIADELSNLTGIPVDTTLLSRVKNTKPQVEMETPQDRKRNIERAFQCTADVNGLNIMLIDDVITTGSTMSECAAELKDAGASHVWGIALARQGRQPEGTDVATD